LQALEKECDTFSCELPEKLAHFKHWLYKNGVSKDYPVDFRQGFPEGIGAVAIRDVKVQASSFVFFGIIYLGFHFIVQKENVLKISFNIFLGRITKLCTNVLHFRSLRNLLKYQGKL
jgi:hypothetical protein